MPWPHRGSPHCFIKKSFWIEVKHTLGKMEHSDQDSCLAWIVPILYIIRACLHIYGMSTTGRATVQSGDCWSRVGVERKHPLSPSLHSLYTIGQASASHQGPPHRILPSAFSVAKHEWGEGAEHVAFRVKRNWAMRINLFIHNFSPFSSFGLSEFIENLP